VSLDTNQLHYSGLTLRASFHHTPHTVRQSFALLAGGRFQAERFLTGRTRLADIVNLYHSMCNGTSANGHPANGAAKIGNGAARGTRTIKTVILP
jgi:threonine dehydrogenase-like Zn-dependent dehydrogenase